MQGAGDEFRSQTIGFSRLRSEPCSVYLSEQSLEASFGKTVEILGLRCQSLLDLGAPEPTIGRREKLRIVRSLYRSDFGF
jgi:hypothetical protein